MKIRMCLPITKSTMSEVAAIIEENKTSFDMFEIWIDYLKDSTSNIMSALEKLSQTFAKRIIVVFRRTNGERIVTGIEKRKQIIKALSQKNMYIDLDVEKQVEDLAFAKELKTKMIITSFHDYKKTPRTSVLVDIIKKMSLFEPAIYKIATFCETEKQALSLLHLLLDLKKENKDVIILGMGKKGLITRIFGALWGNEMSFAPQNEDELTAPGQITKARLKKIFAIVNT